MADPVQPDLWGQTDPTPCQVGDHRWCEVGEGCDWADHWLPLIRHTVAQRGPGARYAVLCLWCPDAPRWLAATADLWSAAGRANSEFRRHGGYDLADYGTAHKRAVVILDRDLDQLR